MDFCAVLSTSTRRKGAWKKEAKNTGQTLTGARKKYLTVHIQLTNVHHTNP
jgi:hypothetical protein